MTRPLDGDPIAEAHRQWRRHGWEDAADGMAAVTSVMRAHQLMQARVDGCLRPLGLSFARFELLRLITFTSSGRMTMNQARRLLQVHPTSLGSLVARLERDGLLERSPNPDDARSYLIAATARGAELVEVATAALNEQVFAALDLEPDENETLIAVLAHLRMRAGDFTPPEQRRPETYFAAVEPAASEVPSD